MRFNAVEYLFLFLLICVIIMCYLMKNLYCILLILLIAGISFCVYAADSSDTETAVKSRMIWEVSGIYNDSLGKPLCVNDTLAIYVKNHNTRKPVGSAFVRLFYGLEGVANLYTSYTGVVYFTPNKTGVYKVFIQKTKYQDMRGTFNVTECTTPTTTSTTTTSTATTTNPAASTTFAEPETTTTIIEASTTTIPEGAASDTSEPAIPACSACKAKDQMAFVYPVAIAMALVVLTWSLLSDKKKRDMKKAQAAGKTVESNAGEAEPANPKKHKSLHHRLGLKKDKESEGGTKK
jgi:hypothetical protein